MRKNIYWFCFLRQLRELYMLLASEKLVDCSCEDFMKHFTGKKISIDTGNITKIKWYGGEDNLTAMLKYLAEKGFISFKDVKVYNFIISVMSLEDMLKDHFKIAENPKVNKKEFIQKLEILFPATTAYRCKTRLYYKARNKNNIKEVLEKCLS